MLCGIRGTIQNRYFLVGHGFSSYIVPVEIYRFFTEAIVFMKQNILF